MLYCKLTALNSPISENTNQNKPYPNCRPMNATQRSPLKFVKNLRVETTLKNKSTINVRPGSVDIYDLLSNQVAHFPYRPQLLGSVIYRRSFGPGEVLTMFVVMGRLGPFDPPFSTYVEFWPLLLGVGCRILTPFFKYCRILTPIFQPCRILTPIFRLVEFWPFLLPFFRKES